MVFFDNFNFSEVFFFSFPFSLSAMSIISQRILNNNSGNKLLNVIIFTFILIEMPILFHS